MSQPPPPPDLASDGAAPLDPRGPRIPASIEGAIAAAMMAALFLITFANVVVRYFTNVSFAFTEEYSVALMVAMALVGSASAFALDRHIRMTFFVDRLPHRARWAIEIGMMLLCAGFFAALAYYAARYTWDEYRFEVLSPGLGVPQWIYTIVLPVFAGVIVLRLLGRLVRVIRA
jgi:TRAP-type C4-dicarboxylate transport system permease small subunit